MAQLYSLTNTVIALMRAFSWYGVSLFDVMTWGVYIAIAWYVLGFLFAGLRGGSDD